MRNQRNKGVIGTIFTSLAADYTGSIAKHRKKCAWRTESYSCLCESQPDEAPAPGIVSLDRRVGFVPHVWCIQALFCTCHCTLSRI